MDYSLRTKPSIVAFSLTGLITSSVIPDGMIFGASTGVLTRRDVTPWPYAVIGDSWGSGVAYNQTVLYDKNRDECLRTNESHGPQLEADTSWTGFFSSGLKDAACSGSQLVDLAKGNNQMGKVGQPNVVVMTSGGNNCGFGGIVDNCIYHSDPRKDYGPAYKDDKNRTGECAKQLDGAQGYITNSLKQDLINTINDILAHPNVTSNPDFLLYLTGYAQFFGTDYDPWCNKEHWNIVNIVTPTPYLSEELRRAFNDRVSEVNDLYKKTIQENYPSKARFIDLDSGFQGHRFCESGASHEDQLNTDTKFENVYLWNLNWPWQVANQSAPNPDEQNGSISAEEAQELFGGNGVTAWSGSGNGGNKPGNGWRLRPFHPRYSGYTKIKDAILAQLKIDGLPKAAAPADPSPLSFTPGQCSFHLKETENCARDSKNLYAIINLKDGAGNDIGDTSVDSSHSLGVGINDGSPYSFTSKLPNALVVTGEHQYDYIQFQYGDLGWQTKQANGGAHCSTGGWDPSDRPDCTSRVVGTRTSVRNMDCFFPC